MRRRRIHQLRQVINFGTFVRAARRIEMPEVDKVDTITVRGNAPGCAGGAPGEIGWRGARRGVHRPAYAYLEGCRTGFFFGRTTAHLMTGDRNPGGPAVGLFTSRLAHSVSTEGVRRWLKPSSRPRFRQHTMTYPNRDITFRALTFDRPSRQSVIGSSTMSRAALLTI